MGLAAILAGAQWRRLGRWWLLLVFSAYLVLALPWIAAAIADGLPAVESASPVSSVPKVDALVILDGDNAAGRARTAARIYASASPSLVVISGDQWLADRVAELGIPPARLVVESRSRNTREQIAEVQQRMSHGSAGVVALIASRLQMPRVASLARQAGLKLILVPASLDWEPARDGVWAFVPTYAALGASRDALYEHAALVYYRQRGWIPAQ